METQNANTFKCEYHGNGTSCSYQHNQRTSIFVSFVYFLHSGTLDKTSFTKYSIFSQKKHYFLSYVSLLLRHWYEIMALYYVKSVSTEISASRQDRRVLQKSKIIRIEFLSKWGMLQTSRYV